MEWINVLGLILFLLALLFGYLARTAKHVWKERRTTRIFAAIAIFCTISVIILLLMV